MMLQRKQEISHLGGNHLNAKDNKSLTIIRNNIKLLM
jgi:hypothetical protein